MYLQGKGMLHGVYLGGKGMQGAGVYLGGKGMQGAGMYLGGRGMQGRI